jgi:hypothetical protein
MPDIIRQIALEFERMFASDLSCMSEEFVRQKRSLLMAPAGLDNAYVGIIGRLLEAYEEVQIGFAHGNHLTPALYGVDADWPPDWSGEQSLLFHSAHRCTEFFRSLEPDVQHFVVIVTLCFSMLRSIFEKVQGALPPAEEQQRVHTAIANSGLSPSAFVVTLELAAKAYCDSVKVPSTTSVLTDGSPNLLAPQDRNLLQSFFEFKEELKQDFDNALDSLKAGQMETIRLIEHNQRPAAAYEADIVAQLGASLYLRLEETTRSGLQLSEYLYHINSQEPNYFQSPVMQLALAYENELTVRVIYPFVSELQSAGEETYDGHGVSREPLLIGGKVPGKCMMLGNLARYLRKDPLMRSKISARGFDVDAIAKDAISIASVRNRAAHEPVCERAVADDLRLRMLCRDSVFSRLHPLAATGPNASN